jgi:hypothetical protein
MIIYIVRRLLVSKVCTLTMTTSGVEKDLPICYTNEIK